MNKKGKSHTPVDHSHPVDEVSTREPPTARALPSAPPRTPSAHAPGSMPTIDAPISGTIEQWQSLSANDRKTLALLDQRIQTHTSLDIIREFFSTGRGTCFPGWACEDFLARVARCTAGGLTSTPTDTGEHAEPGGADAGGYGDGVADVLPFEPKHSAADQSISGPRGSRESSVKYLPAPTLLLRSATFRGIKGKNHKQKNYTPIAALEGIRLKGKGRMLSALDLIPGLGVVKLMRRLSGEAPPAHMNDVMREQMIALGYLAG